MPDYVDSHKKLTQNELCKKSHTPQGAVVRHSVAYLAPVCPRHRMCHIGAILAGWPLMPALKSERQSLT